MKGLIAFLVALPFLLNAQDAVRNATDQFRAGHLAEAEQTLRTDLKSNPNDIDALVVLAAVLDSGGRFKDADATYARLLKLIPHSPQLLNNYGNHLLAEHKFDDASAAFAKVLQLDPQHRNALLQMAVLSLRAKRPAEAENDLGRLRADSGRGNDVALLHLQALYLLKRNTEADALRIKLSAAAAADPTLNLPLGTALSAAGRYDLAESLFARAAQADPGNFDAVYGLGLAASHAAHTSQALEALEHASRLQPGNAAVLYDWAVAELLAGRVDSALSHLAQAAKLAPAQPETQRLLAQTLSSQGFFADAAATWSRYLEIVPADARARRERAFAQAAIGQNTTEAMRILENAARAPHADAIAHYEWGTALSTTDAPHARAELTRAITLDPKLTAAYLMSASVENKLGNAAATLVDLQHAAALEPHNPSVLDRLGEFYAAAQEPAQALPLLTEAASLSPNDAPTHLHLARLLLKTGKTETAQQEFARVRELERNAAPDAHRPGLVAFLNLAPEQQQRLYRNGVERAVAANPENVEAQVRYLEILASDPEPAHLADQCRKVLLLHPSAALLSEAVRSVLAADHPDLSSAHLLLEAALHDYPNDSEWAELNVLASQMTSSLKSFLSPSMPIN